MKCSIPLLSIIVVAIVVLIFAWIASVQSSENGTAETNEQCCNYNGYA